MVAVGRKLAVLLHHLWKTGEVYEPLRKHRPLTASTSGTETDTTQAQAA